MERFIDVPGGRLFTIDEGEGPPILLLHAGIVDLRSWDALAALLVARGHRVARFDRRGAGRTESDPVGYSMHEDTASVLDALDIDRVVLVGNSMGGQAAFDTALASPDRVVGIVGVGAGIGGFDGGQTPFEAERFAEMERLEGQTPPDIDGVIEIDIELWVDGPGQPGRVASSVREAVRVMDRDTWDPDREPGERRTLDPLADERLGELRCPVLAVAGALDTSATVAAAHRLEAAAPNARAEIWPDVAHMIGMEQPERLARTILDFVSTLEPWA